MENLPINFNALSDIAAWSLVPLVATLLVIWGMRTRRRWHRYQFEHNTLSGSMTLTEISKLIGSGPHDTKSAADATPPLETLLIRGKFHPPPSLITPETTRFHPFPEVEPHNETDPGTASAESRRRTSQTVTIGADIAPADLPAANENEVIDPLMAAYMEILTEDRPNIYDAWCKSTGKDKGNGDDLPPPSKSIVN